MLADNLNIGFAKDKEVFGINTEPVCPELNLMCGFLARNIEYSQRLTEVLTDLQKQGRFSDSGVAAEKHKRALDYSAAENSIELLEPRLVSYFTVAAYISYHLCA